MKPAIPIALIVVFTAGMLLGWEIGVAARPDRPPPGPVIAIVVAARDIPVGTRLDDPGKWLTKRQYFRESAPLDAFSRLGDLRGQVVQEQIRRGEPCTARYLAHAAPIGIPVPGSRAVTVPIVDLPTEFADILPGSRADLVYTGPDPETGRPGTQVWVQNALVLAVTRPDSTTRAARLANTAAVTVAVALADVDRLQWARDHGALTLVMRRPNDTDLANPPAVRN